MALSDDEIRSAAERLDHAEKTRKQIRQLSLEHPGITIADAYAIQKAWVEMKVAAGPHRQRPQDRPDLEGDAERAQYRRAGFRHPARRHVLCRWRARADRPLHRHPRRGRTRVRDEDSGLPGPTALCSTCSTPPTSWCRRWKFSTRGSSGSIRETKATRKIFDTIADNAANAGIVLGGRPIRPMDADLRWIGALCYRNGQLEETGLAAGVLNHPATRWPGSPTRSRRMGSRWRPARWCWRGRSSARSRPAKATRSRPIMDPTAR